MKSPHIHFSLGYTLGCLFVIWILVDLLNMGDTLLSGEVGIYFGIWFTCYLPMALAGFVTLYKLRELVRSPIRLAYILLLIVLAAITVSFIADAHWVTVIIEYCIFVIGMILLYKYTLKQNKAVHPIRRCAPLG